LWKKYFSKKADKHLCLNVNFPKGDVELIKGVKVCRQAYAKYEEEFEERKDPSGKKYYWLTGMFQNLEKSKGYRCLGIGEQLCECGSRSV